MDMECHIEPECVILIIGFKVMDYRMCSRIDLETSFKNRCCIFETFACGNDIHNTLLALHKFQAKKQEAAEQPGPLPSQAKSDGA